MYIYTQTNIDVGVKASFVSFNITENNNENIKLTTFYSIQYSGHIFLKLYISSKHKEMFEK